MGSFIGIGFVLLLSRYAYLSLLPSDIRQRLRTQANRQYETEIVLAPPRAAIVDRNGRTLAASVLLPSLFIIPKRVPKDLKTQHIISRRLGIPIKDVENYAKSKKGFAWVERQMTQSRVAKLGDISDWHEFLGIIDEPKRIYPEKELASHLIGFVGLDNMGLEGLESLYNSKLTGEPTKVKVTRDARGRVTLVTPNGAIQPEPSTPPMKLSIDISVQAFAESALRDGILKAKARAGSAVVMDIETGEVLAIASYPTYDLNNPPMGDDEKRRFRPVMDALELGSVVKPIFIAEALDKGFIKIDEPLFCENGTMKVPGGKIGDTHKHGWLTARDIIKVSSNICTYKIVQRLGRERFRNTIIRSGLGRGPGSGLPGEWQGRVLPTDTWREMRFANMAFGQGIAISPLQLTHSMSMVTGGGVDMGVKVLAVDHNAPQNTMGPEFRYISARTSKAVTEMMSSVVEEEGGTGMLASIPGVSVAGKTGTAQKFSSITRSYSERIASFIGVIPAEHPKLAITVVIDEPPVRPAYGGLLAGPVFSEIGRKTVQYLNASGVFAVSTDEQFVPAVQEVKKKKKGQ